MELSDRIQVFADPLSDLIITDQAGHIANPWEDQVSTSHSKTLLELVQEMMGNKAGHHLVATVSRKHLSEENANIVYDKLESGYGRMHGLVFYAVFENARKLLRMERELFYDTVGARMMSEFAALAARVAPLEYLWPNMRAEVANLTTLIACDAGTPTRADDMMTVTITRKTKLGWRRILGQYFENPDDISFLLSNDCRFSKAAALALPLFYKGYGESKIDAPSCEVKGDDACVYKLSYPAIGLGGKAGNIALNIWGLWRTRREFADARAKLEERRAVLADESDRLKRYVEQQLDVAIDVWKLIQKEDLSNEYEQRFHSVWDECRRSLNTLVDPPKYKFPHETAGIFKKTPLMRQDLINLKQLVANEEARIQRFHSDIFNVTHELDKLIQDWMLDILAEAHLHGKREQVLENLLQIIDKKDNYTYGHSLRVTQTALMIAKRSGYSLEQLDRLYFEGLLHDAGKIVVPHEILTKPGPLTPDERLRMQSHPLASYNIGKRVITDDPREEELTEETARYSGSHHERYDGGEEGYPEELRVPEGEIPNDTAILAVADLIDAMWSDRPYREGQPSEKIKKVLRECSGNQLHPYYVAHALELIDDPNVQLLDKKNGPHFNLDFDTLNENLELLKNDKYFRSLLTHYLKLDNVATEKL